MAGTDPYRLWVEFRVKDYTSENLANISKSVRATKEQTAALKKELAGIRAQSMIPTSALQARQQMLRIAREEAVVGERLATTSTRKERQALSTRLQALRIAQRDMSVTRQTLAFKEQQGAAEEKVAAANAQVLAVARDLSEIRARGLGQATDLTELRREQLELAREEAAIREQLATTVDLAERAALQSRLEAVGLAERELQIRRQTLGVDKADRKARLEALAQVGHGVNHVGTNLMFTGGGIFAGLAYATQKAMVFDQTALETDMALGGYTRSAAQRQSDIRALQKAAMIGSEATGFFSAQDILEGLKMAASSGSRPLVEKMGMGVFTQIAPSLSQFMDVLGRLKGESAGQAAKEAIQTAHMFGAYKPADIARVLNAQAALTLLMPDKMSTAVNTLAYAAPAGVQLAGIPQEAILALLATADQSGLGHGRAGARLKNYIEAVALHQSAPRERAKAALGIHNAVNPDGSVDLMRSFEILMADRKRMGAQAFRDAATTAFGQQGVIVAAMFGDESKQSMFNANRAVIEQAIQHGDLSTIQNLMKGTALGKEAQAMARLNNDLIEFGRSGIPIATKFFDTINPKLKQFGDWMQAHPKATDRLFNDLVDVGGGMLAFGAAFKVFGTALAVPLGIFKTLQALKMAKDLGTIAKAVKTLGLVESAAAPEAEALAGIGTISAGTVAAVTGAVAAVAGLLYGVVYDEKHPTPSFTGLGPAADATAANYGLLGTQTAYTPLGPGKTTADLSALKAKVEFELPKNMPRGTRVTVHAHLQSIMGTNPRSVALPKPVTVGGMSFGTP
ncbi:MAG TPA: hypothetical protein VJP85_05640 [Candidatus Baltobacteraceae bacterium]|nr:hypothetical protein [Candidatus Baltobacteraceae bacterium]